jgi:hypothetical protein
VWLVGATTLINLISLAEKQGEHAQTDEQAEWVRPVVNAVAGHGTLMQLQSQKGDTNDDASGPV